VGRLGQVLVNIVDNAIKFTERGEVIVEAEVREIDVKDVVLHFKIKDTGIGISPEKHELIFKAFEQADKTTTRNYGGTGLGLAIAASIIQAMAGRIWIESQEEKGSVFHFTCRLGLPQPRTATGKAVRSGVSSADLERGKGRPGPLRILVVEDNPVNQKIAVSLLERRRHKVTLVSSGRQALLALSDAEFDLVLMDLQMPEMDGLSATREIRRREARHGGRLPIIAMTAHAMPGDRERCLEAGMDDYLAKPIDARRLDELVHRWVSFPVMADSSS
jgi:CheY-like chemotaxis protein